MRRAALNFLFLLLLAAFLAPALHATQQPPSNSPAAAQQQTQNGSSPSSPAATSPQIDCSQENYRLHPAARSLSQSPHPRPNSFFPPPLHFFYGLLILWFILHRKLSAKYRDWPEKFSRKRFFQALLFTPLLVLTIGVLQLPLDVLQEWIEKLYGSPSSPGLLDW